jgi:hypothetical protein
MFSLSADSDQERKANDPRAGRARKWPKNAKENGFVRRAHLWPRRSEIVVVADAGSVVGGRSRTDLGGRGGVGAKCLDGTGNAEGPGCYACHEM